MGKTNKDPIIWQVPGLTIRQEQQADHRACEEVVREAFFNRYRPGCQEHLILHKIRNSPGFLPWHSLVAEYDGQVIGQVLLSPARLQNDAVQTDASADGAPLLALGPLCVLPAAAGRGVGSALMRAAIHSAREHGAHALFLTGDPRYYHRFGFQAASRWNIRLLGLEPAQDAPFFMALPLFSGAMSHLSGVFCFSPLFDVSDEEVAAFDATFPPKKPLHLPGQFAE